jgi:hypothetical protein
MASILLFEAREDAKPRDREAIDAPRGEVVIFPGVRIERYEHDPETPAEAPRRRARARKK